MMYGNSGTEDSPLSRLPPELFLMIARFLPRRSSQIYSSTTLHKSIYVPSLLQLSLVNKSLRSACMAAGLFKCIRPRSSCGLYYHLQPPASQLSSLTIDLSEPPLWDMCANIMKMFPNLGELGLSGIATGQTATELCDSALGDAFQRFKGSSLALKNVVFDDSTIPILLKVSRTNITRLYLQQCELFISLFDILDPETLVANTNSQDGHRLPLCPNVQIVSYVYWRPLNIDELNPSLESVRHFTALFLERTKNIQHVGLTYGCRPFVLENRHNLWKDGNEAYDELNMNRTYQDIRRHILMVLREYSQNSLLSFTEYEGLSGPFIEDGLWWHIPIERPFQTSLEPFKKMKLLAFQCSDFDFLLSCSGIEDYTVGRWWRASCYFLNDRFFEMKEQHIHSLWFHVIPPLSINC